MWQERFKKKSLIRAIGGGWSISSKDTQPLDSRLALMARSTLSKITERSVQILRLLFNFSKASRQRLFLKSWTLKEDTEGVEGTLLALVFLGMVLEKEPKTHSKKREEKKTEPRADRKLAQKKKNRTKAIWCMNRLNDMMRVLK